MGDTLVIRGGRRLQGEVAVSGGKNAALAICAATVLCGGVCSIENLPDIDDLHVVIGMLRSVNAKVDFGGGVMRVDASCINRTDPSPELACRMRASYYFAPVLLGLLGHAEVALPGGCDIGTRPIDQTLKGMRALGADVRSERGVLTAKAGNLRGADVYLDMPSVGATVNTVLTAVCAEGTTTINNCAKEPHIVDLANFLNSMGARVRGAGTSIIRVTGKRPLHGSSYAVIPDQIETGTLMIAAAATKGDVTVTGAIPTHMEALSAKLLEMGVSVEEDDDRIRVRSDGDLRGVDVKTMAYPGFPTDLQQPLAALLSVSKGVSRVTETIFEQRFRYAEELQRMGADISLYGRTAHIRGVETLVGAPVTATDLRAGAALIIAGLMAEGTTEISGLNFILRGYEDIDLKLRSLGGDVRRV